MKEIGINIILVVLTAGIYCVQSESIQGKTGSNGQARTMASQFSLIANKLWNLDKNRAQIGSNIHLSLQGNAPWNNMWNDYASRNLVSYVSPTLLNGPTYKAFLKLLNNYNPEVNQRESITTSELEENYGFLNEILKTPVIKEAHKYLVQMGKSSSSVTSFKGQLYDLWFKPYYRSSSQRIQDSSGFEHVFAGEINSYYSKVIGFHSWLSFYMKEQKGSLNYLGYLKKGKSPYLIMTQFEWKNQLKKIGSFFVGTSPEFDIALYTITYLMDFSGIPIYLNGMLTKVTCFGINRNRSIGTCYPDIA